MGKGAKAKMDRKYSPLPFSSAPLPFSLCPSAPPCHLSLSFSDPSYYRVLRRSINVLLRHG
jgi:hypothetical protein